MTTVPPRPARPRQLGWLGREVSAWEDSGLLHEGQADAILDTYRAARRFSPRGLAVTLVALLLGVGSAWVVAAPLGRPLAPWLLGVWGGGALLLAYLRRDHVLLLAGIGATTAWWVGRVVWEDPDALTLVVALGVAATACVAVAAVHETRLVRFGAPWREVGAALALVMVFVAALPSVTAEGFAGDSWVVGGPLLASVAVIAALTASEGSVRLEPLFALVAGVTAVGLVLWEADAPGSGPTTAIDWVHAGISVTAYVVLAVAVALLGIVRDSWRLTTLATVGIVAFALVQGYAALTRVIEGVWPLVLLGAGCLATGYLLHLALRRLAASPEQQP